ncbi:hypothetical protein TNCT_691321 [Trichonephila clavata]|uniref:Ubiquitin-like protease family profile domain-containing protein n=1 Tax=Trichonephila clavata TaxID=2740835 RepID=A0A8X6KAM6_TRICU|nr:hypothetical protein TNCT_691321 [Trichonephila clavata]
MGFQLLDIVIKKENIEKIWLLEKKPVLFIRPTSGFAEEVRNSLGIDKTCHYIFNPEKINLPGIFITFITSFLSEEQIDFIDQFVLNIKREDQELYKQLFLLTAPKLSANFVRMALTDDDPSVVWEEGTKAGVSISPKFTTEIPILRSKCSSLQLSNIDIMYANNGCWLNDNIVNFYLEYIYSNYLTDRERNKTFLFNSYFYTSLTRPVCGTLDYESTIRRRHDFVAKWTKEIDIFTKHFIAIPVNLSKHWFLVIVCFANNIDQSSGNKSEMKCENMLKMQGQKETLKKQMGYGEGGSQSSATTIENSAGDFNSNGSQKKEMPCICVFDSLYCRERFKTACNRIREYLEMEYYKRKGVHKSFLPMKIFSMRCPQQPNSYDCGVYVLENFQRFFQKPIENFGDPMPNLEDWYHPACILKKRKYILHMILATYLKENSKDTL